MKDETSGSFHAFIVENRVKINHYLNVILWIFVITGPAIAMGVKAGIFSDITFTTCFSISLVVVVLAGTHLAMLKRYPYAIFTSAFALTALDALIVYMAFGHVSIHLTWYNGPLVKTTI